jgi:hypothetical protein
MILLKSAADMRGASAVGHTPSLRAQRSNPECSAERLWIASSQEFLAMTAWRETGVNFNLVPRMLRSVTSTVLRD